MEHALLAARDGMVAEVLVTPGAQVEAGAALVRLEDEADDHPASLSPDPLDAQRCGCCNELGVEFSLVVHPFDKTLRSDRVPDAEPGGPGARAGDGRRGDLGNGRDHRGAVRTVSRAGLGRPPGAIDRPDWLIWVHFAETISQHSAALTQQHIALYEDAMRTPIVMQLEAKRLEKCYAAIEARLSTPVENRDYLLTTGFSAADISVGQAVYMARHFAAIERLSRSRRNGMQRITDRPAFQASLPPGGAELLYARDFYPAWEG